MRNDHGTCIFSRKVTKISYDNKIPSTLLCPAPEKTTKKENEEVDIMKPLEIKFSPQAAWSYAWSKGIENKRCYAVKLAKAITAFVCTIFSKYTVSVVDVESIYLKYNTTFFSQEYSKKRSIYINISPDVRPHNSVEQKVTKIAETEEQQANNISEPEIDSDSSYKTKDVHTRKRMIQSKLDTKIKIYCSKLEFLELIESDGFLDTHHYIVDGNIRFFGTMDKISLPKYLTVKGSINCHDQINLSKLPDILIIEENTAKIMREPEDSAVDFSNCTGLVYTNNTEITVEEHKGNVSFYGCCNMKRTPIAIYLNHGQLILTECSSITRFPKYVDSCKLFVVDGCNKFNATDYDPFPSVFGSFKGEESSDDELD